MALAKNNIMRIKEGFNIHTVCGDDVIVAEGEENIDFSSVIGINETASFLWRKLVGTDFTIETMVKALTDEYEVDETSATADCERLVQQWKEIGLVE